MSSTIPYVYIKSGDIAAEFSELQLASGPAPDGGPLAFLHHFLKAIGDAPCLLLSTSSNTHPPIITEKIRVVAAGKGGTVDGMVRSLKYLLRARPKIILCGEKGLPLAISMLCCLLIKAKVVFSSHNTLKAANNTIRQRCLERLNRVCVKRASACVCHGPFLREELVDLRGPEGVFEFDTGIADLSFCDDEISMPSVAKMILFIGRMEKAKGILDLLDASESLLAADDEIRLVYVGTGKGETDLREAIQGRGLAKQIELVGKVSHSEIAGFIRKAYVVVTPTRSNFPEGRCMVAMEALYFGVPVIAPNFGPFPYLVKNEVNGLLYQPDSPEGLRFQLARLLKEKTLRQRLSKGAKESMMALQGHDDFSTALGKAFAFVVTEKDQVFSKQESK